jgi:FKBP-type peptidyl-prolyl cis-trans isomerase FkpA
VRKIFLIAAVALLAVGCNDDGGGGPTDPSQVNVEFTTTDLVPGTGAQAAAGNSVTVHYTGWLYNPNGTDSKGTQFDTSSGRDPLPVVLGVSNIIPGFQQAILGMSVGGKRRVYIPPSLGYGSAGVQGAIPPNASLVFEIELITLVQ